MIKELTFSENTNLRKLSFSCKLYWKSNYSLKFDNFKYILKNGKKNWKHQNFINFISCLYDFMCLTIKVKKVFIRNKQDNFMLTVFVREE